MERDRKFCSSSWHRRRDRDRNGFSVVPRGACAVGLVWSRTVGLVHIRCRFLLRRRLSLGNCTSWCSTTATRSSISVFCLFLRELVTVVNSLFRRQQPFPPTAASSIAQRRCIDLCRARMVAAAAWERFGDAGLVACAGMPAEPTPIPGIDGGGGRDAWCRWDRQSCCCGGWNGWRCLPDVCF